VHYEKTGEVPAGYVLHKDEILFEGAVIMTYTEDRQFMSDVYGTARWSCWKKKNAGASRDSS
jgi:hypothetical protein